MALQAGTYKFPDNNFKNQNKEKMLIPYLYFYTYER